MKILNSHKYIQSKYLAIFFEVFLIIFKLIKPHSYSFDLYRIIVLSSIFGFYFLYSGTIAVETGVMDYLSWSDSISSGTNLNATFNYYIRDVGMSLIALVSGYSLTHSILGIIIIQAVMAICIAPLVYNILYPWFPQTAYWTSILSILSLGPFLLSKTLHHDQPFIFFMILSIFFANKYLETKRPDFIYYFTFTILLSSLIRQVGKGLFPFCIIILLLFSRKNYKHFLICFIIFLIGNNIYSNYRHNVIGDMPAIGITAFENVYLNSSNYKIIISPELGPYTKHIYEQILHCSYPHPNESEMLKNGPSTTDFMNKHFYIFNSEELAQQIFLNTNREYLYFLIDCISGDSKDPSVRVREVNKYFFGSSIEVLQAHPFYILSYALRNSIQLLYDPGWLHSRNTLLPHMRGGLLYPFNGASTAGRNNVGDNLPEPALSEAEFIPIYRQHLWFKNIYFWVESVWVKSYHALTIIYGLLGLVTLFSTLIGILYIKFKNEFLRNLSFYLLSEKVLPATINISLILILNVAITGIFIDSYYRYDYSIIILKIILACVGVTILINFLKIMLKKR